MGIDKRGISSGDNGLDNQVRGDEGEEKTEDKQGSSGGKGLDNKNNRGDKGGEKGDKPHEVVMMVKNYTTKTVGERRKRYKEADIQQKKL